MPRQWPWYALQIAVAAVITVWIFVYDVTPNATLGAGMALGGAYLATIGLRWLLGLFARAEALVRKKYQPAKDVERIAAARRHLSDLRKPYPRFAVGQKPSNLINPPTKPPTV